MNTTAKNIHKVIGQAKGKRDPIKKKSVPIGKFFTTMPDAPIVDLPPNYVWPMDGNDVAGDCVVAGFDHTMETISGLLTGKPTNFSMIQLWNFYITQNPDFNPNGNSETNGPGSSADNGMDIQTFLEWLVKNKYILGFGSIDYTKPQEMEAAMYIGLSIIVGVQLQDAQMQQFADGTWDYIEGSPIDGGHCITKNGYDTESTKSVSWGKEISCTPLFDSKCIDEAWFILTQDHVDHPAFRNSFNLAAFAEAVSEITNGKVVVPVTPTKKQRTLRLENPILTGDDVKQLQKVIGATIDGKFGPKTKAAVIAFQHVHHLRGDGIVGPVTWAVVEPLIQ